MSEFALQMQNISKVFDGLKANDSIDFSVKKGSLHALAGENGAGKSTLMKILFGLLKPEPGGTIKLFDSQVQFNSPLDAIQHKLGMVQQHFALAGALTSLDNIILGAEPSHLGIINRKEAREILKVLAGDHLSVPWEAECQSLSVGFHQRIEILKLLFRKAEILILDEPTAVLTPQEVDVFFQLLRRLKEEGRTVILITHKLGEVLSLCDHVTVLRQGKVSADLPTRGLTEQDLIRAMIGRDLRPLAKLKTVKGSGVIESRKLSARTLERGGLKALDLVVHQSEIVGVAGVEGSGQSCLVESLLGLVPVEGQLLYKGEPLTQSTAYRRNTLNFGVISEDRHDQSVWLSATVAENAAIGFLRKLSRFGFLSRRVLEDFAKKTLEAYDVKMRTFRQPISDLSGGNQQKLVVAREVTARKPEFLIASHPTRGVDVGAIEIIHRQLLDLRKSGAAILLISSELEELRALCDRIIVLYEGRKAAEFEGPSFDTEDIGRAMTGGSGA